MDVDSAIVQAARKLGYGDVKSEQSRVIREIVAGNDVFVALPTGYGKSLCYALAHTRASSTAVDTTWQLSLEYNTLRSLQLGRLLPQITQLQVAIVWVPHAHENVIAATLAPPSTFQCSERCEAQSPDLSLEWTGDQTNF